mmetsp:Transcript_32315/g.76779  ORF Transcript_32315/g.76779 Transcript_32315/m.76779 type:complete len:243 (+) Transcript_32315:448-1176(+)
MILQLSHDLGRDLVLLVNLADCEASPLHGSEVHVALPREEVSHHQHVVLVSAVPVRIDAGRELVVDVGVDPKRLPRARVEGQRLAVPLSLEEEHVVDIRRITRGRDCVASDTQRLGVGIAVLQMDLSEEVVSRGAKGPPPQNDLVCPRPDVVPDIRLLVDDNVVDVEILDRVVPRQQPNRRPEAVAPSVDVCRVLVENEEESLLGIVVLFSKHLLNRVAFQPRPHRRRLPLEPSVGGVFGGA